MSIRFGRSGAGYDSSQVMETADDDWRCITDLAERRKIQNRLAQRNYRRKLRQRLEELERQAGEPTSRPAPSKPTRSRQPPKRRPTTTTPRRPSISTTPLPSTYTTSSPVCSMQELSSATTCSSAGGSEWGYAGSGGYVYTPYPRTPVWGGYATQQQVGYAPGCVLPQQQQQEKFAAEVTVKVLEEEEEDQRQQAQWAAVTQPYIEAVYAQTYTTRGEEVWGGEGLGVWGVGLPNVSQC